MLPEFIKSCVLINLMHRALNLSSQRLLLGLAFLASVSSVAFAEALPGPADIERVKPLPSQPGFDHSHDQDAVVPRTEPMLPMPEAAKNVHFVLNDVQIEGVTAFTPQQLVELYGPLMHQEITLEAIYKLAEELDAALHRRGLFSLTRARAEPAYSRRQGQNHRHRRASSARSTCRIICGIPLSSAPMSTA